MVYRVACDIDCFNCYLDIPEIKERGGTCAEDKTKLCRIFGTGSKKNNRSKKVGIYNQEELGKRLNMSQQSLSKKLRHGKFTMKELQNLFKTLEFSDEEILKVMKTY